LKRFERKNGGRKNRRDSLFFVNSLVPGKNRIEVFAPVTLSAPLAGIPVNGALGAESASLWRKNSFRNEFV
jgi:hypothetical protein